MLGSGQSAIFLLVAFAALICHSTSSLADTRTIEGTVVNVADGDTFTVLNEKMKMTELSRVVGLHETDQNVEEQAIARYKEPLVLA